MFDDTVKYNSDIYIYIYIYLCVCVCANGIGMDRKEENTSKNEVKNEESGN